MQWLWAFWNRLCSVFNSDKKRKVDTKNMASKIWLDLSPLESGTILCDCDLTGDESSQRQYFRAVIPGVSIREFNRVVSGESLDWNVETTGILEDGRHFTSRIGTISKYSPVGPNTLEIEGELSEFRATTPSIGTAAKWRFKLTNLKFRFADLKTPNSTGGWALDAIEFVVGNKTWRLTDSWVERWKDVSKAEKSKIVLNGLLETNFDHADDESEITETVDDICSLLSFALSRSVSWLTFSLVAEDGTEIQGLQRSTWVTSFNKRGLQPVTNDSPGSLKSLIEGGITVVQENRDWFRKTLGMLNQAQIADMADVRCSILYTLTDRISSYVVRRTGTAEIDPQLKPRARQHEFIQEVHGVLQKLSPENWTLDLTKAVLNEIKRWNSTPHFATKIQRACSQLHLPEPDRDLLVPRNDLLHDGELNPREDDLVAHYLELDWVVLTMVLRLLEYSGTYYHPKFGQHPVVLQDQLTTGQLEQP